MARLREAALVLVFACAAACSVATDDLAITDPQPPTPTPAPERTTLTPADTAPEPTATPAPFTLPPDFEFTVEPEAGPDDPPAQLGLDDPPLGTVPGPGDVTYVGLCGALSDIVGDTVNDVDAAVATIRRHTPGTWLPILDAAGADLRVRPVGFTDAEINALDGFYYDECEVPLFAGSALLDRLCRGSRVCVRPVVQAVLGGVCVEEIEPVAGLRRWLLLSCVSGLPA